MIGCLESQLRDLHQASTSATSERWMAEEADMNSYVVMLPKEVKA